MKKYLLIVSICALGLVEFSGNPMDKFISESRAEKPSAATRVNFWDPIPPSPSTTIPEGIQDGYWRGQFQRVNREIAAANGTRVVFFGDSITLNWSIGPDKGQRVWNDTFSKYNPINMGNSGDITPVMLYRVRHGNLDFREGQQPDVAVLLCGTNNFVVTKSAGGKVEWDLGAECPPEDVAHGVRAIAQEFRRRLPQTHLIVMGILPVANEAKRAKCRQVNDHLNEVNFDKDEVVYVDLWDEFVNPDGSLHKELFTDGTHLTTAGYRVWAAGIEPLIAERVSNKTD